MLELLAVDLSELVVVPETTPVNDLLLQFRDKQRQVAAVIDKLGRPRR